MTCCAIHSCDLGLTQGTPTRAKCSLMLRTQRLPRTISHGHRRLKVVARQLASPRKDSEFPYAGRRMPPWKPR